MDFLAPKVLIGGTDEGSALLAPLKMADKACNTVWPFFNSSKPSQIPEATYFSLFVSTSFQYLPKSGSP